MCERELSNIQKILIYIVAFCFVLNIGCVYTHTTGTGILEILITYFPAIILLVIVFLSGRFKRAELTQVALGVVFLLSYLIFGAVIGGANAKMFIAELFVLFSITVYYLLIEQNNKPFLLIAYRDIVLIICIVSLFFWLFGSILQWIHPTSTVISNWGVLGGGKYNVLNSYFNIYFELDRTYIFGIFITSNRSIFVERAFAAFAFSVGWFYELFLEEKRSQFRLAIFFIAMISTFSMTALILVVITAVAYYLFNGTNQKLLNFLRVISIPIVLGLGWYMINYLITTKFSMGRSGVSRMNDFNNGFDAWILKPLFGYGFGNGMKVHQMFKTGYSNSISMILTQGGIHLSLLYFIAFAKAFFAGIKKKRINSSLFVVVVFIVFSFTAIAFTNVLIYLLLFMFCANKNMCIKKEFAVQNDG